MMGAVIGDIIGSAYEYNPIKTKDFPLFQAHSRYTDDTVMTIAVADAILEQKDYAASLKSYGRRYPQAGYGARFNAWLQKESHEPYNSFGNGAAMRVSPVGWALQTIDQVLHEAQASAAVSHNHPEGIKGAQATALAVFLARQGASKADIRSEITARFGYELDRRLENIRPDYRFDISCQGTVPEAMIAFLEAESYEDTICNAISLGGDSDTLACIAGGIAEAFYKDISAGVAQRALCLLPYEFRTLIKRFYHCYAPEHSPCPEAD